MSYDRFLTDILAQRAREMGSKVAFTYLNYQRGESSSEDSLSYADLYDRASGLAQALRERGLAGERILLAFPSGTDFIVSFFACLLAPAVPVPIPPPDPQRTQQSRALLEAILQDATPKALLTVEGLRDILQGLLAHYSVIVMTPGDGDPARSRSFVLPSVQERDIALLQYTSGSTGRPKGVMVSHGNLIHNLNVMRELFGYDESTIAFTWVPIHHNTGLISSIALPLYLGFPSYQMSPLAFLQSPMRWIREISRVRAMASIAPNFSYDLCVQSFDPEVHKDLDLSCWLTAGCGGEPVQPATIERFTKAFSACGFRREAFRPGYGMSEATLVISGGPRLVSPLYKTVLRDELCRNEVRETDESTDAEVQKLVGCGRTSRAAGQEVVIVDPETRLRCASTAVGEIWVKGPCVAMGYWNRPEETEKTFHASLSDSGDGPFLRTGDLGFISEGELFITGRLKELIILRGKNYYPEDIEKTVEASHPALRPRSGSAFSVTCRDQERLVIVHELERRIQGGGAQYAERRRPNPRVDSFTPIIQEPLRIEGVLESIRKKVSERHVAPISAIVLIKAGSHPRTPSGKIQRQACRQAFLNGTLDVLHQWLAPEMEAPSARTVIEEMPPPRTSCGVEAWFLNLMQRKMTGGVPPEPSKPMTAYGLDSLRAVEIMREVEKGLGVDLLASDLFESTSIAGIIRLLESRFGQTLSHELDLKSECVLEPSLSFKPGPLPDPRGIDSILLTGATGFVGAFLLEELFRQTKATLYCLVRAREPEEGRKRIRENLQSLSLWREEMSDRILPVCGDLSKPRLGLSPEAFQDLAGRLKVIYHNGAAVNFIYSYRDLKASNVLGTNEILRLASAGKDVAVHYVSTLSVFPTRGHPEGKTFFEDDNLEQTQGLLNGYAQSKWVAEHLMKEASRRGLRSTVYRVGEVIGHSVTGACQPRKDAYSTLMKGCIELGAAPRLNLNLYFVPVDYVVQAVVRLSGLPASSGKAFHLTNPVPIHVRDLFGLITEMGFLVPSIDPLEWMGLISEAAVKSPRGGLASFLPFLESATVRELASASHVLKIDCRSTQESLGGGILCPPPGKALFTPYISFLKRSGFIRDIAATFSTTGACSQ